MTMNRNHIAAILVTALAAPCALAQSSVTIGGTVNILWDSVRAKGNTGGDNTAGPAAQNSLKSADRVRDGGISNIRFTVVEDLGGGNAAFVQVESAVIQNSDTRTDAVGNAQGVTTSGNSTGVWGNRNSGIGIRSKTAGRFLIGVWEVHYTEHSVIEPGYATGNQAWAALSIMQNLGSGFNVNPLVGARLSNVIRWDSPVWSGFSMAAVYGRPTDGAPPNLAGTPIDGKINRVWNIAPRYVWGGLTLQYSYIQDQNAVTNAAPTFAGQAIGAAFPAAWKITGNRLGGRYKFDNGIGVGLIWDESKYSNNAAAVTNTISVKRSAWALPVTWDTGNHHLMATYGKANDWRGQVGGVDAGTATPATLGIAAIGGCNAACLAGTTFGSNTGASMFSIGYMYNLSTRTNVSVGYVQLKNDALVRYEHYTNASGNTAVGGDPKSFSLGLRHTW
jgi:predicted porin